MTELVIVALGGGIGSVLRYLINNIANEKFNSIFPFGTFIANFIGCLLIGILMTLLTEKFTVSPYWRLLITVGFLGGLTTFSSFSYETIKLLQANQYLLAMANIGLNLFIGFIATAIGIFSVRSFN